MLERRQFHWYEQRDTDHQVSSFGLRRMSRLHGLMTLIQDTKSMCQTTLGGRRKDLTKEPGKNDNALVPATMEQPAAFSSATGTTAPIEIHERTSLTFPVGQGDITLITIDSVIFHVHRAVLRHSSHVFETIFEIGEDNRDSSSLLRLKMEADAPTLDHLLTFAYPNKLSPSIHDINILAAVFRVAKRYEMDGVLQQLGKSLLEIRMIDDVVEPPLYIKSPLVVLAVSYAFECTMAACFALRECLKGSLEEHLAGSTNFDVPLSLLSMIMRLRKLRLDWFVALIDTLPWPANGCFFCARRQGEWRVQLIRDLHTRLLFESFRKALFTSVSGNCVAGHVVSHTPPHATVESWSAKATKLEGTLPAWPHLSH